MKPIALLLITSLLLSIGGCKEGKRGKNLLPNPLGTPGEILVILDKSSGDVDTLWHSIQNVLAAEYPFLPQPEPTFNLVRISPAHFKGMKGYRNILLAKTDKTAHPTAEILIRYDAWASPQIIVSLVGPSASVVAAYILKERDKLVAIFEQAERDRQIASNNRLADQGIKLLLKEKFNVSLAIPTGFNVNKKGNNFVWISNETALTSLGLFIYTYPYQNKNTFTKDYLVAKRDSLTREYIPGPSDGSYMITGHFYEPQVTPTMFKDRYYAILRGLWEVHNDYMGGPFVSITTLDEKNNRVITVDGYVYAPKEEKRNYLRQVESILFSLHLLDDNTKSNK